VVPASAASRASAVTCPTVDPKTGAVTPNPTEGVDWAGCDLAGAYLFQADLRSADLAGTNLTRASFLLTDLTGSNLSRANLLHTDLSGDTLTSANLTDVSGPNANFTMAELTGADFTGAKLPGGLISFTTDTKVNFTGAQLDHVKMYSAKITKSDFAGANLISADLGGASFAGDDLEKAELRNASVAGTALADADLAAVTSGGLLGIPQSLPPSFSVTGGYLVGPHADLAGANLAGAFAVNASFAHVNLSKADLDNADVRSADFDGANAAGALLKGTDLTGAELTATNASLKNVTWSAGTICPNGHAASATAGCFAKPAVARPPAVTVSVRRGAPGTTLTLTGSGFAHGETLMVSFDGRKLATVTTGSAGSAGPLTLTVPRSAQPGLHRITAAGKVKTQAAGAWFTVAVNWDQASYDSGLTNYNPRENTLTPAKARTLTKKFLVNPGAGTSGAYAPTIDDGVAYIASAKGPLTAVNAATGKTLWTWKEPVSWDSTHSNPRYQLSQPVSLNGIVYLSVAVQGIAAIRPPAKLIWTSFLNYDFDPYQVDVSLAQPTLYQGVLYTTERYNIYSADPVAGYWDAATTATPAHGTYLVCGQPAVASGVVYVRCHNGELGELFAYTAPDLTPLWTYTIPGTPQAGRLAVSGGTIYLTTSSASGGGLVAITATTHKQKWQVKTAAKLNAPAIAGNTVYAVTQNGLLIAQNATTGAHRWTANLHDKGSVIDTFHPSVADGVVYALNNNGVAYAFNAKTGAQLWSYQSGGTLQTAPVIANGILYIGTKSGGMEAFAAR
jgi:uncharacterized protein YjbI with pentapeptide repeats/outer membrane protein assembly factor BamB